MTWAGDVPRPFYDYHRFDKTDSITAKHFLTIYSLSTCGYVLETFCVIRVTDSRFANVIFFDKVNSIVSCSLIVDVIISANLGSGRIDALAFLADLEFINSILVDNDSMFSCISLSLF